MSSARKNGHLYRSLQSMSVIPLLVLALIITVFSYYAVKQAMHTEVHIELRNTAENVMMMYDLLYPGDYYLEGTNFYDFYKGTQNLTDDHSIVDRLKADTQTDVTIFYQDTRILTTICNTEGRRITGTGAGALVIQDVLFSGQPHFYTNTEINGQQYFAYYTPLRNSDGSIVGMIYAGKPCTEVNAAVRRAVLPIILIAICSMAVVSLISSSYTRKLTNALQKIRTFLSKVSTGNLWEELDFDVLRRNDELSEMGYSALYMQRSLRNLVEQDTLTELNNRRFADKHLKQTQMNANTYGNHFVVAIGDIDLFKSVNDTYGHDCGDVVLKRVASVLKNHMIGKGFVARWGGEEFLFLYDNLELGAARAETEKLLQEIRSMAVDYEGQTVRITMTFGLAEGGVNTSIRTLLQTADAKLYEGKESGRNRIIS
ncbi:MAG: diguanylate cyclase [Lachnospiraceae bacterium]